jgi:hypothetical protein
VASSSHAPHVKAHSLAARSWRAGTTFVHTGGYAVSVASTKCALRNCTFGFNNAPGDLEGVIKVSGTAQVTLEGAKFGGNVGNTIFTERPTAEVYTDVADNSLIDSPASAGTVKQIANLTTASQFATSDDSALKKIQQVPSAICCLQCPLDGCPISVSAMPGITQQPSDPCLCLCLQGVMTGTRAEGAYPPVPKKPFPVPLGALIGGGISVLALLAAAIALFIHLRCRRTQGKGGKGGKGGESPATVDAVALETPQEEAQRREKKRRAYEQVRLLPEPPACVPERVLLGDMGHGDVSCRSGMPGIECAQ